MIKCVVHNADSLEFFSMHDIGINDILIGVPFLVPTLRLYEVYRW